LTKQSPARLAAFLTIFAALFAAGCKENTIINTNISPAGDSIVTEGVQVDITARTVYSHFITSSYFAGTTLAKGLGVLNTDPEIGKTDISLYMQIVPKQSSGYSLPAADKIDSIVLVLPYFGSYGDTSGTASAQTYTVYQVTPSGDHKLKKENIYYDTSSIAFNSAALGQTTVSFSALKDSVEADGAKRAPHLRIRIDDVEDELRNANYNSYSDFQESFNGLYIKASDVAGRNNIPYFRMTDDGSNSLYSKASVVVYYRNDADSVITDVFPFNPDNCAQFNKVVNDISGSNAASDTSQYIYLQSRPGLSVEIKTTDVKNLPNRLVNKAVIIITEVASADADKYSAPEYLYPYVPDSKDSLMQIADAVFTSPGGTEASGLLFIDGKKRSVKIGTTSYNQYIINVPREFQKALKEKKEMTLRITGVTGGYYIGAYRLKAGKNQSGSSFNIRMNVVYSGVQ
jgi:hypothetical protein